MKFGNYNITTTPKERSRKLDIFRFSKIKSTTNSFVDRFQSKIETFRRLKSRSESPLSFRASLFEREGVDLFPRPVCEKFSPKDFPKSHFRGDNFYVFGNTIRKLGVNKKSISGKNNYLSENFYYSLKRTISEEESQQPATAAAHPVRPPRKNKAANSQTTNQSYGGNNNNNNSNKNYTLEKKNYTLEKKNYTLERKTSIPSTRPCDAIEFNASVIGSNVEKEIDLNNVNKNTLNRRRYTNSLKDMLDSVSYLDEDTEFKVLKDYFETNSYSDIVKDTAFKDYLNKKNYNDILDYLNDEGTSGNDGTMRSIKRQTSIVEDELPTSFYDNATDNSKLYKWKSTGNLYESLSSYNNNHHTHTHNNANNSSNNINSSNHNHFNYGSSNNIITSNINSASSFANGFDGYRTVDRLETSTYRRQRKPPTYIGSTTSLNRRTNSKMLEKQRERDRQQESLYYSMQSSGAHDKFLPFLSSTNLNHNCIPTPSQRLRRPSSRSEFTTPMLQTPKNSHYEDVKRFCELFLNEHYTFNNKWNKIDTSTLAKRYTERQYKKLINKFIKSKGYSSSDEYVQAKFGAILDRSIPKPINVKSEKLDLPKTYIDNVQRRYHVTKQHFLAAERIRKQSALQPTYINSHSLNDLYR